MDVEKFANHIMSLCVLPTELLELILLYLDACDILTVSRVSHFTYWVYSNSARLRYIVALHAAGAEDVGEQDTVDTSERLAHLLESEDLWNAIDLRHDYRTVIPVDYRHSHVHGLSAGIYMFGDLNELSDNLRTENLLYVSLRTDQKHLGSCRQKIWKSLPLKTGALNIGASLEDFDLLVVLTCVPISNSHRQTFQLHFKRFTTSMYHPWAKQHVINFHEQDHEDIAGSQCLSTIEIAGPRLLVLLTWLRSPSSSDELYVYDWTKGTLISHISPGNCTYRGANFISPNTIIVANIRINAIEFLSLQDSAEGENRTQCIGRLELPILKEGVSVTSVRCRTDSLRFSGSLLHPNHQRRHRIYCAPSNALVEFRMYLQKEGSEADERITPFTFVTHRTHLLRSVEWHETDPYEYAKNSIPTKSWHEWGPNLTRWSGPDEADTAWAGSVAGQRQIFVTGDKPRPVHVRNFNAATIRKALLNMAQPTNQSRIKVVTKETVTANQGYYQADVRSSLPFVETQSGEEFDYDGVLIDEDHVIGFIEDEDNGLIKQLDTFAITPIKARVCDRK